MRILIATVTAGGGHLAAAAALNEAWLAFRPEDTVRQLDLSIYFSTLHRKLYSEGYVRIVARAPELWGLMFNKTDDPKLARRLNKMRRLFPSNSQARFARFLREFAPEVVLCTHYLPLQTLGRMSAKAEGPSPYVVSIVTDFEAHALWMEPCVDLYCVAAEHTRARVIARGAAPGQAVASGIPISSRFEKPVDPRQVRQTLGLRDDQPVLLVLSGGFGMGPVGAILAALDKVPLAFQTVVVTGKNQELRRELAAQDRKHPTHVLGFVSNMYELMAASELILSKPGGLTTSEALALGKPMLIIDPIPGQEAANSDFLLQHGAAQKVNRTDDLPFRVEQLLASGKLAELGKNAAALGKPQAARQICVEVARRVNTASAAG